MRHPTDVPSWDTVSNQWVYSYIHQHTVETASVTVFFILRK